MTVLTVNTGSSSVRLAAYGLEPSPRRLAAARLEATSGDPSALLEGFLREHGIRGVRAVAHRIVHGGSRFTAPCLISDEVETEIRGLAALAPLHNPQALSWIAASRDLLGRRALQIAVFDTAFYSRLPEAASTYALPFALAERHRVRRYGFHGLAHEAMWLRWRASRPDVPDGGRVISLQLGAGCSITAVDRGRAVDTSMGFSPLEGLVMATRCGDLDPGAALHLQRAAGLAPAELERVLNHESGLLGLSGSSADMAALLSAPDPRARRAVEIYCYRARKYVGAYLAALGGADAILFGGGVGEHAPEVRRRILAGLEPLGIEIDRALNDAAVGREARISAARSKVEIRVIAVDEAGMLVRAALSHLGARVDDSQAQGARL